MKRHRVASRSALATLILALASLSAGAPGAHASCEPLPRGVTGFWAGDGDASDLTLAGNDGQPFNGVGFGAGLIGDAFVFDGIDDRVEVPDAPNLRPSRFTLSAWIRLDTVTAQACIVCKQYGSGDLDSYSLWLQNGVLRGGMFGFAEAFAGAAVPVGRFLHAAVTYDGGVIRLYLDGALVATASGPAAAVPYDANPVILGADDNGVAFYRGFFDGTVDEAMIFGRALSDCEIRAIARAVPDGACKGDADGDLIRDFEDNCPSIANAGQLDGDGDGAGEACDCAPADPSAFGLPGDPQDLRFESKEALDWCLDPSRTGDGTLYDLLRGGLDEFPVGSGSPACRSRCVDPLPDLVGWWTGDDTTADLVGGNFGTLENGATYGTGRVRSAFRLDGLNDRVRTGNMSLGSTFSVLAWVRSDLVNQGSYKRIVETSYATHFYLGTDASGGGYKFIVKSPSSPFGAAQGGAIVPGFWQLVAGTYDGTTGVLYLDGKAVASDLFPSPGAVNLPVNIGAYLGGGSVWKGGIDEVLIFDRALSASEIRAIHDAGCAGSCKAALGGIDAPWTTPFATDGSIPAPGAGFWYLYRGRNACGVGSYGFASGGGERVSVACD